MIDDDVLFCLDHSRVRKWSGTQFVDQPIEFAQGMRSEFFPIDNSLVHQGWKRFDDSNYSVYTKKTQHIQLTDDREFPSISFSRKPNNEHQLIVEFHFSSSRSVLLCELNLQWRSGNW